MRQTDWRRSIPALRSAHPLAHHPAEERDVCREHRDAEEDPDRDPERISLLDLPPGVLEIEQLGDQDVDRDQQQDDGDAGLDQPLRIRKEARLRLREDLLRGLFVI
jgi:hypothetical protein